MRLVVCACTLSVVASCYSPQPGAGAPCTPGVENCPSGQTCELVAGAHVCVAGVAPDASPPVLVDAASDGGPDATLLVPWALVQTRASSNLRRVTIGASGAGHLIVVAVQTNASAVMSVTDDANHTYVPVAGSRAVDNAEVTGVELWYAKDSSVGATTITASADTVYAMAAWEVAGIRTASSLDTASLLDNQPASTSPFGASITTSAAGEFVVSVVIVANDVTDVTAGSAFTNDHTTFGNGWAHLTSAAAPAATYRARWSQPMSGTSCATSAAFFAGP